MSIESFIQAMPKVELHVHLDGATSKDTLITIAEQNDVHETLKHYKQWLSLLDKPDYARLDELIQTVSLWVHQPEDLTRLVYDVGVYLARQNVRYAEVSVTPTLYMENGLTFEQFLNAINDGRDRVKRGWNVDLAWILIVPRHDPRRADDVVRWATSVTAKKGGVVALGLSGRKDIQSVDQFERSFKTAHKKGIARVIHAGDEKDMESVLTIINDFSPNRITDGWGIADAPDVIKLLVESQIPLDVCIARELCLGRVESYANYPLRHLYDDGITLTIGSDMPSFYKTTLVDEYLAVAEHCDFDAEEIEILALNAVRSSLMADDEKQKMLKEFADEYARLRAEHILAKVK